jgi:hypothetical protein
VTDAEAQQEAPIARLIERVRATDRGGCVASPDVGDAGRDDEAIARFEQQRRMGQRLAAGGPLAEPRGAVAEALDAGDRCALLLGRLESDRAEPNADPTYAISQFLRSPPLNRAQVLRRSR